MNQDGPSLIIESVKWLIIFVRLPEGFTQLHQLTELYLNDAFLDFLPGSFGRLVWIMWLSGWVVMWLNEWSCGWMSGFVVEWVVMWLNEWVCGWLLVWISCFIVFEWNRGCGDEWLNDGFEWLSDWFEWLSCVVVWVVVWLAWMVVGLVWVVECCVVLWLSGWVLWLSCIDLVERWVLVVEWWGWIIGAHKCVYCMYMYVIHCSVVDGSVTRALWCLSFAWCGTYFCCWTCTKGWTGVICSNTSKLGCNMCNGDTSLL